ncbi:MAG: hypothetical protein EOM24_03840 [Chloroflexia bacterium]|nr:hypothetical protein [Chloroflexia bacterium]
MMTITVELYGDHVGMLLDLTKFQNELFEKYQKLYGVFSPSDRFTPERMAQVLLLMTLEERCQDLGGHDAA